VEPKWFQSPIYAPWTTRENFRFPFWLQPEKYYAGPAWYQAQYRNPSNLVAQACDPGLGTSPWQTRVWLDGKELGFNNSLSTPHRYELGMGLAASRHVLTVRVDNSRIVEIGEKHSWNLRPHPGQLEWDRRSNSARGHRSSMDRGSSGLSRVEVRASAGTRCNRQRNRQGRCRRTRIASRFGWGQRECRFGCGEEIDVQWQSAGGPFETELTVAKARPWDEFHPTSTSCVPDLPTLEPRNSLVLDFVIWERKELSLCSMVAKLFPRHAGVLHFPADRPPSNSHERMDANHQSSQGPWSEYVSFPFLLPS
jgi:hypothetical protein